MAEAVRRDIEIIRQLERDVEEFAQEAENTVQLMNGALLTVKETWQDHQLDKPSEDIVEANARIMRTVTDLCSMLQGILKSEENWTESYLAK